jgi:branched-chain amino acid transport system ATP-binding protein
LVGVGVAVVAQPAGPLLRCANVQKSFGALKAVKDLSFVVDKGEILGIGGPNGAGKTTLFEVLSGFSPADNGEVIFKGRDITTTPPDEVARQGVARVFQSITSFGSLSTLENVLLAVVHSRSRGLPLRFAKRDYEFATSLLSEFGLTSKSDVEAARLPIIDRKKLMLATAMALAPDLLLMDEPVGGLTPGETNEMISFVKSISTKGVTIILIEHVIRFMTALSDRILIMHQGEKIFEGLPSELRKDRHVASVFLGGKESRPQKVG